LEKVSPYYLVDAKYKTISEKILTSDNNGKIVIPSNSVFLGLFQDLLSESLYINIDFTEEFKQYYKKEYKSDFYYLMSTYFIFYNNRDKVIFINKLYFPVVIYLLNIEGSHINKQENDSNDIKQAVVSYPIDSTFGKQEKEIIIVKLIKRNIL
jgi:hypothetical protein